MINAVPFRSAFEYPPAWLMGALSGAGVAWAGDWTLSVVIAGAVIGLLLTTLVGLIVASAHRINELDDELREMRRLEATLRGMLHGAEAVTWRCDDSLNRLFVSSAWKRLTGQGEIDAADRGWRQMIHAEDLSHYETSLKLATMEQTGGEVEYRLRSDEGGWVHMFERFVPMIDEQGEFAGLIGIAVDFSQRKRLEADQRQQIEDLQSVIAALNQRSDSLASKHEQMERRTTQAIQREQDVCEYLAALSGELRHPVSEIRDAAGVLKQTELGEQQRADVRRVADAASKLDDFVERSIELTALDEQAGSGIEIDTCDLRAIIEQVTDHLSDQARQQHVHLASHVHGSVPALVKSDPYRLRRVLLMLWGSAIEQARKGTVTLDVTSEGKSGTTAHLVFSVMLPSKSMSQEVLDRAFYPEQSLDSEGGGMGLGRCQRMAEHLGGRIGVERDESGAANFWFKLNVPVTDASLDGRRAHNRLAQESIRSNLGLVLDLSKGGMRVQSRKLPEDEVLDVELSDDEDTLLLRAEVAWSRKTGFRRFEIGLRFIDFGGELEARLTSLATRNRVQRSFEAA